MDKFDVIIIGAGAAGLFCAIEAGKRGRRVLVLDHANKPGKKILMSGGGRCNFTNYHIQPSDYLSHNSHFCISALSRYTQWDFIDLVKQYKIPFHEKALGQLFCDNKSKDILDMLLNECQKAGVDIRLSRQIISIDKIGDYHFKLTSNHENFHTHSLVIATGGLSIPTMGASPFGYKIAEQFGLKVWPTRAGLVPFTLIEKDKEKFATLSGVSINALVSYGKTQFKENILFTHRGLSGPAILQISSYWVTGGTVQINLLPELDLFSHLIAAKRYHSQKQLNTIMQELIPKKMIEVFIPPDVTSTKLASISNQHLATVAEIFNQWTVKPNGTEGYRTAEVTLGGVDCDAISSKTMAANAIPGLYFIGEVLDVTGWLGGFNFQWAWSSGWAAGQAV